jgi:Ni/Fe-hydrogenase subunit HybB-like protein
MNRIVQAIFPTGSALHPEDRIYRYAFVGLAVTGLLAIGFLLVQGHAAFNTSSQLPWGLPVSTYLYLVLTATGLTFVSSFSLVFGFTEFYPVAKRCAWLSIAALIGGFTSLALEIGHPFRMLWALPTGMQYISPMFWMGIFYTLYLIFIALKFQRVHAGDWHSNTSKLFGLTAFITVIIAHSTLGLVFGMMTMRPLWYDGMIAVYFLFMAALSGAALTVFFTYAAYDFKQEKMPKGLRELASGTALPKIFATLIGLGIMMIIDRTVTGLWTNLDGFQVYEELLRSPLWHFAFWIGLVLPFFAMLHSAVSPCSSCSTNTWSAVSACRRSRAPGCRT